MNRYFITATGTDIGKTLVMTSLVWQWTKAGKKVLALKPVISGFDGKDANHDAALILKSGGAAVTKENIHAISPWRFAATLAPSMAAEREKKQVALSELLAFCRDRASGDHDVALVEGAGGIMSPISSQHTVLDWMEQLGWPAVLVAGTYLGAISHTLTACEALRARGVKLAAIIINESKESGVPFDEAAEAIKGFLSPEVAVLPLPRLIGSQELWKHTPDLARLLS